MVEPAGTEFIEENGGGEAAEDWTKHLSTAAADIDFWRSSRSETQTLEFKEAKTGYDSAQTEEYCAAIVNEGGAHLVLGAADKASRHGVGTRACNDVVGMAY